MAITDAPAFINPIAPYVFALKECVCAELTELGGPLCWCGIYPGAAVSLEFCEECDNHACGQGWVRVVQAFPSDRFPIQTLETRCNDQLAWMIEVGAVRCMPVLEDGEVLGAEEMNVVANQQLSDAHALYRALLCCEAPQMAVANWIPIGPDGGCIGGFWTAYLGNN